jgi:hypothetical protein
VTGKYLKKNTLFLICLRPCSFREFLFATIGGMPEVVNLMRKKMILLRLMRYLAALFNPTPMMLTNMRLHQHRSNTFSMLMQMFLRKVVQRSLSKNLATQIFVLVK